MPKLTVNSCQKIRDKKLSSRAFWRAFDLIISEKSIKKAKQEKGYEPNEKVDIDELSEIIDDSKIKEIERGIWESLLKKYRFLLDVVLYDTTNFYTYHKESTGNSLAQFGKSKEGKDNLCYCLASYKASIVHCQAGWTGNEH